MSDQIAEALLTVATIGAKNSTALLDDSKDLEIERVLGILAQCPVDTPYEAARILLQPYVNASHLSTLLSKLENDDMVIVNRNENTISIVEYYRSRYKGLSLDGDLTMSKAALNQVNNSNIHLQAITYYRNNRKPQSEWRSIADLRSQLAEFHHLVALAHFDEAAALLNTFDSKYLMRWGNYSLALKMHEQIQGRIMHKELNVANLTALGIASKALGEMQKAKEYFEMASKAASKLKRPNIESAIAGNLGSIYLAMDQIDQAIVFIQRQRTICQTNGDKKGEAIALSNLGVGYLAWGKVKDALHTFEKQIVLVQQTKDKISEAIALGNQGLCFQALGDLDRANVLFNQQIQICQDLKSVVAEGYGLANLGNMQILTGDYDVALKNLLSALAIATKTHEQRLLNYALNYLTVAYISSSNFAEAKKIVIRMQKEALSQKTSDVDILAGVVFACLNAPETAKEKFNIAVSHLSIRTRNSQDSYEALYHLCLANAGLALYDVKYIDTALQLYQQAILKCSAPGIIKYELMLIDSLAKCKNGKNLKLIQELLRAALSPR